MGRIAKILAFFSEENNHKVKIAPGGEEIITAEHFASVGDDAPPLISDFCITVFTRESGSEAVVGYVDPVNQGKAVGGEKRIYARNIAGVTVVDFWLKSDGSIRAENQNGSFEMQANGDFVVNGVIIDVNGNLTVPNSLTLDGKEIAEHVHAAGTPPGDTGPNK